MLPFRLINMYSLCGDTVLDPFLGTATTALAAMACGRNSAGCEMDPAFGPYIGRRLKNSAAELNLSNLQRLKDHLEFVRQHTGEKGPLKYVNSFFGFSVMTGQERELRLPFFPMLFLTGASIPLEIMPKLMQDIASFLPVTHVVKAMKAVWLGETISSVSTSLLVLAGVMVVCFFLSYKLFRWE